MAKKARLCEKRIIDAENNLYIAIQCHHYFTYDRYTSEHMRKHIIPCTDGDLLERFPLRVLADFPRIKKMCVGDIALVSRACRLLKLQVHDDMVTLP